MQYARYFQMLHVKLPLPSWAFKNGGLMEKTLGLEQNSCGYYQCNPAGLYKINFPHP